ncbi:MAG TPA: DUF3052 family protein [Verrucomicrobiota bacterium]|nr:DUF3052 domain-containing protein [Verrucomicrobiales bacterium]HRI11598.1 DUF3052 family protein [Verrucomicrobiota bacterium]
MPVGKTRSKPTDSIVGYSGKPLVTKLGFRPGMRIALFDPPKDYQQWLTPMPPGIEFVTAPDSGRFAAVHCFVMHRTELAQRLARARRLMEDNGFIWISWPKKSAKVATDVTEDVIRDMALKGDLVDVKVCAVSEVWSGLKLCVRRVFRAAC